MLTMQQMLDPHATIGDLIEYNVRFNLTYYGRFGIIIGSSPNTGRMLVAWLNGRSTFDYSYHRASSLRVLARSQNVSDVETNRSIA